MFYVESLSEAEKLTLREMHHQHPLAWTRKRAQAVLLSSKGYPVQEIATIHEVCRQTVSSWLKAWEQDGVMGLVDQARSGRPDNLTEQEQKQLLAWLKKEPRSIKQVQAKLKKHFGKTLSGSSIKRLCKKARLVWKRLRTSLKDKRDPKAYKKSVKKLAELIERELNGELELYYFDQSGFTLVPCIPYAWQLIGQTLELPSTKSRRLNVLGFMDRSCDFHSYVFEGTIDTSVVIACFEAFIRNRTSDKEVVVVLDNSPLHTSEEFEEQLERWAEQGLTVEFIAPYSPELNLIEILWRKIKYEWLPLSAYESLANLREKLLEVLKNIGTEYKIVFS